MGPIELTIRNESDQRQRGWCDIAIPFALGEHLPAITRLDPMGWIVVAGPTVGVHSRLVHVFCDLNAATKTEGFVNYLGAPPAVAPVEAPQKGSGAADLNLPLVLPEAVTRYREELMPAIQLGSVSAKYVRSPRVVSSSAARLVVHAQAEVNGVWVDQWWKFRAHSHVVDWTARVLNSDRKDQAHAKEVASVLFQWAPGICKFWSRFAKAQGLVVQDTGDALLWRPPTKKLGDGEAVILRGQIGVLPISSTDPDDEAGDGYDEDALDAFRAAEGGPISGVCQNWAGQFLAFESVPAEPHDGASRADIQAEADRFDSLLQGSGSMFDLRPFEAPARAANGGSQAVFAMTHSGRAVTAHDPSAIGRLLFSADAEGLRPEHHLDESGVPIRAEDRPNLSSWERRPHKSGSDKLGKGSWPPNYGVAGRTGRDDQHLESILDEVVALTGDEALQTLLDCQTQIDAAQARIRQGNMGVARAVGRVCKHLANVALVTDSEDTRKAALDTLVARIRLAGEQWTGKDSGPVKILHAFKDWRGMIDPATGQRAWTVKPPFEAIGALGLWAASKVLERFASEGEGYAEASAVARSLALQIMGSWVLFLTYFDRSLEQWVCPYQMLYLEGGKPLDQSKLDVSQRHLVHAGGSNWWDWTMGLVLIAQRELPHEAEIQRRCEAILKQEGAPRNWEVAQWWAAAPLKTFDPEA